MIGCADLDALFTGDHGGADHVHIRVGPFHDPRNHTAIERIKVHLGHGAIIKDVDRLDRLIRHLADERAQMPGQFDPWPHHFGLFGSDRWHVQRVGNRPGQQVIGHLLCHL